jgi:hypothetical protein
MGSGLKKRGSTKKDGLCCENLREYRRQVWQDVIASMNKLPWNNVGHKFCGAFIRMVAAEDFKLFLADRSYRLSEYHHCESWGLVLDRLWEDAVKGLSGILKILKTVPTKIVHKSLLPMPSTWDTIRGGIEFSKRGLAWKPHLSKLRKPNRPIIECMYHLWQSEYRPEIPAKNKRPLPGN